MEIGTVEGAVNTEQFSFEAHKDIEKFDFITVKANTDEAEWLLAQVQEVEKQPLDDEDKVDDAYKTVAEAQIIGYRHQGLLKKPRTVIEPDSIVYRADQDVIADVLGLNQNGLRIGVLETEPDIDIYLDPEELYKHIAVLAKTGAGKCVSPDTPILMSDGRLRPIRELFQEEASKTIKADDEEELVKLEDVDVQSLAEDGSTATAPAIFGYRKKAETVIRIKLASGREITVSEEHPLLVAEKDFAFHEASSLTAGEHIAIPEQTDTVTDDRIEISDALHEESGRIVEQRRERQRQYQNVQQRRSNGAGPTAIAEKTGASKHAVERWLYDGNSPAATTTGGLAVSMSGKQIDVPDDITQLSEFLALIIAEGTEQETSHYRALFTNENEELLERFNSLVEQLFGLETREMTDNTVYTDSNALQALLEDIGYTTVQQSRDKDIPGIVMRAPRAAKQRFLQTYFDCEGWMDDHEACVSSASKDIVNKLAYLLLEFGIVARLREKEKEATNADHDGDVYYQLAVSGVADLERFANQVGFGLARKQEKLEAYIDKHDSNTNVDTVTVDGDKLRQAREAEGLSQRELAARIDMSQMSISRYENENRHPSRKALKALSSELDFPEYQKIAASDLRWDRIADITVKENPHEYVYDLTVGGDHTFIAGYGGIINHNSYATGVLIEELLEKDYPIVIIDPHGEYHTLQEENDDLDDAATEKYRIEPDSYTVQQYSTNTDLNEEARNLAFSSTNMDANEIQQVVPTNLTNSQLGVLYTALKELKERDDYTLDDVIDTCQQQESKAKWNLINMLEAVRDSGLFADNPTPLEDLITQGEATIINLRGVDPEQQEMAVYQLAKELFERRKRGELEPFFLIIEEAHNFIPEKGMGKAVCSDILRKIASEGRKFGLGLGVISQRPANVAKNILSQCNTQLIMRVTNPNDLNAISRSFEGVTKAVEESITSLPPGVGMVLGKEYPIMTDIRVRKSRHGGETKEVSREEGLEKREDAKKLDQQAEEAEIRVDTEREDEEAEEAEDTAQQEEEEETQKITVFDPAMSFEEVQEKLDEPKKAYYPIWIIETGVGRIAVDATDGTVKDRELNLKEEADQVLQLLKQHRLAKQQIIDQVDMDEDTVTAILDRLQEHELIHRVDGEYTYRSPDVFSREQHEIEVGTDTTVIEPDVDEETAIQTAEAELHTGADSTRLIYYPYYTAGNRVFDAVMGKEV